MQLPCPRGPEAAFVSATPVTMICKDQRHTSRFPVFWELTLLSDRMNATTVHREVLKPQNHGLYSVIHCYNADKCFVGQGANVLSVLRLCWDS